MADDRKCDHMMRTRLDAAQILKLVPIYDTLHLDHVDRFSLINVAKCSLQFGAHFWQFRYRYVVESDVNATFRVLIQTVRDLNENFINKRVFLVIKSYPAGERVGNLNEFFR